VLKLINASQYVAPGYKENPVTLAAFNVFCLNPDKKTGVAISVSVAPVKVRTAADVSETLIPAVPNVKTVPVGPGRPTGPVAP
jgi:hypothetical protein